MTSTIDTATIGKAPESHARAKRRHVRSLTGISSSLPSIVSILKSRLGDFPEVDDKGQEKWPKGDEKTWKVALRGVTSGELSSSPFYPPA
jgi:starch phosphorylase